MKKLASLFALLTLAGPAGAGGDNFDPYHPVNRRAFVSFQCSIFRAPGPTETIIGIDAVGWSLPGACTVGSRCGWCADALLNDGFTLDKAFGVTQANSSYAGPYFVFIR